jgi:hypothetical protein
MQKIVNGLILVFVLVGCATVDRQPQQVVGNVGDKTIEFNHAVAIGKSYSKCWIERETGVGLPRIIVTYSLNGTDKFTKENLRIEETTFRFNAYNKEKYGKKTAQIIGLLRAEAHDICDDLSRDITGDKDPSK